MPAQRLQHLQHSRHAASKTHRLIMGCIAHLPNPIAQLLHSDVTSRCSQPLRLIGQIFVRLSNPTWVLKQ